MSTPLRWKCRKIVVPVAWVPPATPSDHISSSAPNFNNPLASQLVWTKQPSYLNAIANQGPPGHADSHPLAFMAYNHLQRL